MLPQQFQVATRFALSARQSYRVRNIVASQYDFSRLLPLAIEEADTYDDCFATDITLLDGFIQNPERTLSQRFSEVFGKLE
jgi:hypothetical protein